MWVQSLYREDPLEGGMTTHSSILVWRIPWTEEPGGLQSIGLLRVGHNWSDLAHTLMKELPVEGRSLTLTCHGRPKASAQPSSHPCFSWFPRCSFSTSEAAQAPQRPAWSSARETPYQGECSFLSWKVSRDKAFQVPLSQQSDEWKVLAGLPTRSEGFTLRLSQELLA